MGVEGELTLFEFASALISPMECPRNRVHKPLFERNPQDNPELIKSSRFLSLLQILSSIEERHFLQTDRPSDHGLMPMDLTKSWLRFKSVALGACQNLI
jgi:hypothetical protein